MNTLKFPIEDMATIKSMIPHREPMILVSAVLSMSEIALTSSFSIKKDNLFVDQGRFTEAGLIENMAQTAACLARLEDDNTLKNPSIGYLVSIKDLVINSLPKIDKTINTKVIRTFSFNGLSKFNAEIECDGFLIAKSELTTAIQEKTND